MKHYFRKTAVVLTVLFGLLGGILFAVSSASAASIVSMFTKYAGIAVTPGESINYSIVIINNSSSIQRVSLQVVEQPEDWETSLTAGGWSISQLYIRPHDEESFNLQTEVPLQVEKGSYNF